MLQLLGRIGNSVLNVIADVYRWGQQRHVLVGVFAAITVMALLVAVVWWLIKAFIAPVAVLVIVVFALGFVLKGVFGSVNRSGKK